MLKPLTKENATFEEWKVSRSAYVFAISGMFAEDLPDLVFFRDEYDNGETSKDSAINLLENVCDDMGMNYADIFA